MRDLFPIFFSFPFFRFCLFPRKISGQLLKKEFTKKEWMNKKGMKKNSYGFVPCGRQDLTIVATQGFLHPKFWYQIPLISSMEKEKRKRRNKWNLNNITCSTLVYGSGQFETWEFIHNTFEWKGFFSCLIGT